MEATLEEQVVQLAAKEKNAEKTDKKEKTNTNQAGPQSTDQAPDENQNQTATQTSAIEQVSKDFNVKNVDWAHPSWDLFLVGFFLVGSLLYGISLGKDRIIAILMSIYMALAVSDKLPDFVINVNINEGYAFQVGTFVAVFVGMFFMLSRSAIGRALPPSARGGIIQTVVLSFLHVGLIISVVLSFMPEQILSRFSETTQEIFTNEWAAFGWLIAPIVAMLILGRGQKELA